MHVTHENLVESQDSTQNCVLVLQDEDIKWKAKELEQLENLDKIKEKRSLSSRVEKIGFDCEQASNGMASSLFTVSSSVQSQFNQVNSCIK